MKPSEAASKLLAGSKASTNALRMFRLDTKGWSFVYSGPSLKVPAMGFSAQLIPKGRGSTEADWYYLGEVLAAIGSPYASGPAAFIFFTDVATANPNSVLKWLWK